MPPCGKNNRAQTNHKTAVIGQPRPVFLRSHRAHQVACGLRSPCACCPTRSLAQAAALFSGQSPLPAPPLPSPPLPAPPRPAPCPRTTGVQLEVKARMSFRPRFWACRGRAGATSAGGWAGWQERPELLGEQAVPPWLLGPLGSCSPQRRASCNLAAKTCQLWRRAARRELQQYQGACSSALPRRLRNPGPGRPPHCTCQGRSARGGRAPTPRHEHSTSAGTARDDKRAVRAGPPTAGYCTHSISRPQGQFGAACRAGKPEVGQSKQQQTTRSARAGARPCLQGELRVDAVRPGAHCVEPRRLSGVHQRAHQLRGGV